MPARQGLSTDGSHAYERIANRLRAEIREGRYPRGQPLPTEMEICQSDGVSRQTVRRAFQDLVAEGLVRRIPGKGTFVESPKGKYLRSSGSIEDLLSLSLDTDLEILSPPTITVDIDAAGRLHLETDEVVAVRFRRLHMGRPYCVTSAYLPVHIGRDLVNVASLRDVGRSRRITLLSVVQEVVGKEIAGADQMITACAASADIADRLECPEDSAVLRIDRLYFDRDGHLLELAINHFNPNRYTYRFQMRSGHA